MNHALVGDLSAAAAALEDAMVLAASAQDDQIMVQFVALQLYLARERLELREAADLLSAAAAMRPGHPLLVAAAIHLDVLAGRPVDPNRLSDVIDRCGHEPTDWLWMGALAEASCCAALLGDAAAARRLFELLEPYARAGRMAIIGPIVCLGAAAYFAGLCARTMGDLTAAVEHLTIALRVNDTVDARPQLVRTRLELARVERDRRDTGPALEHAAVARALARTISVPLLDREVAALDDELHAAPTHGDGTGPIPGGLTSRESEILELVVRGLRNRDIARKVAVSEKTVERHLGNVYTKLGVRNRAEASAWAVRNLPHRSG
jgi:DNA-binding CsgD family transcriptional regulator